MQTQWFRPFTQPASDAASNAPSGVSAVTQAEFALIAETLLRASVGLLDRVDPVAVTEQICRQLVDATPHISLVWVWFGDPFSAVIKPQVVVGSAHAAAAGLTVPREFLTQNVSSSGFATAVPVRSFDISPLSLHAPWRHAAMLYGARNVLVVPIAEASDQRGLIAFYSSRPKYFEALGTGLFAALGPLFYAVLTRARRRHDDQNEVTQDRLTGLHTRSHAQRLIDEAWRAPPTHQNRGVLLLANIDEFQRINMAGGRRVGDLALRHIAGLFAQTLRPGDLIARWRGDEFLVWLPGLPATAALATGEQLRSRTAETPLDALEGLNLPLHVSVGVTAVPTIHSFATALDRAGRALMKAKQNGRNGVVVARPET